MQTPNPFRSVKLPVQTGLKAGQRRANIVQDYPAVGFQPTRL